ncbi:DUF4179 domain-containing protein [Alkalihalobacterium chitinilyticum]|uniref:Anti-sigma-W factor RsiW n=1 Tax=Alkalihalobacterium chitinilyticum TaxID=2980103 RepID=A0ABT5VCX7_9BACI|nr:DUF4179 domain-containing protein [Alkalihalobacterium chitinilyticum]MDE5413305.1 DUF4179 domain-containing protein [Alkalihalobacterium chitinilyticum]
MSCKRCEEHVLNYIEGRLGEEETRSFEHHLNECEDCREEYMDLQQMMSIFNDEKNHVKPPDNFMRSIKEKIQTSKPTPKPKSKRKILEIFRPVAWVTAILFSFLFIGTAFATNGFSGLFDWWKQHSVNHQQQVDESIAQGVGERLNIEKVSGDVKVTITNVVADDLQTHIYYEIEDLSDQGYYMMDFVDGIEILNTDEYWADPYTSTPLRSHVRLHSDEDFIVKGRLGVSPMGVEEGVISLQLTQLAEVLSDWKESNKMNIAPSEDNERFSGNWTFDIPIQKHPMVVKEMNVDVELDGHKVKFDKITIAPTMTILSYQPRSSGLVEKLIHIQFQGIEAGGRMYERSPILFGNNSSTVGGTIVFSEVAFDSMYLLQPEEIFIHIDGYVVQVQDDKEILFDFEEDYSFEYLGTKTSIEDIHLGNPTTFKMIEEVNSDRQYGSYWFELIYDDDPYKFYSSTIGTNGVIVDAYGQTYEALDYLYRMNELEEPQYFTTESDVTVWSEDETMEVIQPIGIQIIEYQKNKWNNKKIEVDLR